MSALGTMSLYGRAVIRGDMHLIRVGAMQCSRQCGTHVTHASDYNPQGYPLIIGEGVIIGHRAILHGCTLGNQILVGNGAVISGAVVEDGVIVGAGCIVPPQD